MDLGAFSLSLAVKDLAASQAFYEALGFDAMGGDPAQGWLIMKGPTAVIGLFQGMFERNMLTFNPGWDGNAQTLAEFTDVRAIQSALQGAGLELTQTTDPEGSGPAHISLLDPDGNPVLIDQHV
ncbi:glyoxalase [Pararhodobacter oceanensis]|uniref:Glyoxalase n=2 Tax=Pararhodobacter oceanensis TaxID=2172121 RepID=A0A2T8HYT3_9RHOB|nr:glyoxalase [Pararhodobacter oceanensis]